MSPKLFELLICSYYSNELEKEIKISDKFKEFDNTIYFNIFNLLKFKLYANIIPLYNKLFYIEFKLNDIVIFETEHKSYYDLFGSEYIINESYIYDNFSTHDKYIYDLLNNLFTIIYVENSDSIPIFFDDTDN